MFRLKVCRNVLGRISFTVLGSAFWVLRSRFCVLGSALTPEPLNP